MPGTYGYADPLFLLIAALALESYLGRVDWLGSLLAKPRGSLVRFARRLEQRLNRPERDAAERRRRGWLVALLMISAAALAGWLLALVTRFYPFAWPLELLLLILLLRQRRTWEQGNALAVALVRGDLQSARSALMKLAGGDLDPLAAARLSRGSIASFGIVATARRLSDGLVSPVFWYVLLGPGGLALQQMSLLLGRLFGDGALYGRLQEAPAGVFAEGALCIARLLEWLPSQMAALLLMGASFSVSAMSPPSLRAGAGSRQWPETLLIAALGPPPHDGIALRRALILFSRACILQLTLLALLLLLRLIALS